MQKELNGILCLQLSRKKTEKEVMNPGTAPFSDTFVMPHFVAHVHAAYSRKPQLSKSLWDAARGSYLFGDNSSVKVRIIPFESSGVAAGDYVHVEVKLMEGRTPMQKNALGALVLEQVATVDNFESITCEVLDLQPFYFKAAKY